MGIDLLAVSTADEFQVAGLRSRASKAPHTSTAHLYRAMSGGAEVALVVLDVHEGVDAVILYELFLCPERRNRGVGNKVLAAVEAHVRASGKLHVDVWPRSLDRDNRTDAQLVRWYRRHGYVPTGSSTERLRKSVAPG